MVKLVKFKDISKEELEVIINKHYNHWKKYNPMLDTYLQQVEKNEGGYGELFYKEVD